MPATKIATAKELGRLLKEERKRKGYTQTTVARYAGVGINFVSNLENGKETTEIGKAMRVANTLGMDLYLKSRSE